MGARSAASAAGGGATSVSGAGPAGRGPRLPSSCSSSTASVRPTVYPQPRLCTRRSALAPRRSRSSAVRRAGGASGRPGRPSRRPAARCARARPPRPGRPTPERHAGRGARRGLERRQAPALGRRRRDQRPGALKRARPCARGRRSRAGARGRPGRAPRSPLSRAGRYSPSPTMSSTTAGCPSTTSKQHLDALVALQAAQVDQGRLGRPFPGAVLVGLGPVVVDLDGLARDAELHQLARRWPPRP